MERDTLISIEHRLTTLEMNMQHIRDSQDRILKSLDSLTSFKFMTIGACVILSTIIGALSNILK